MILSGFQFFIRCNGYSGISIEFMASPGDLEIFFRFANILNGFNQIFKGINSRVGEKPHFPTKVLRQQHYVIDFVVFFNSDIFFFQFLNAAKTKCIILLHQVFWKQKNHNLIWRVSSTENGVGQIYNWWRAIRHKYIGC